MHRMLQRAVQVEPQEVAGTAWSFAYFFCLLSGYYVLRPLREEMGIAGGVQNLPWVFTGTFLAMLTAVPLFGAITSHYPRRRFLSLVYYFFIANLLLFFALFQVGADHAAVARAFFIWTSVFNLFVVSVFWSLMVDLFSNEQGRRLFGVIAAGGSAGAIMGPALTALLVPHLGPVNLLLAAAALLTGAVVCIHALVRWSRCRAPAAGAARAERPLGGGILDGIRLVVRSPYLLGICLFIWLFTTLSTFVYFTQAHIVAASYQDPAARTALFATMDFAVNVLTIIVQAVLTGRLIRWLGVPATLALVPEFTILGCAALGIAPVLSVLIGFQILRRAGDYAVTRPGRELLFTVVGREVKYKAKNFIDTVVYRGGDAVSGWVFAGLTRLGVSLAGIAWVAVPVALLWAFTAWALGRRQETLHAVPPVHISERAA